MRDMGTTRRVEIEGAYNVRDLGGYETADGRRTRWRTFLRADSLHRLTASTQARLVGYGLRTVVDLRRTAETEVEPNVFAGSTEVRYHHKNMMGDSLADPTGAVAYPARVVNFYNLILDERIDQIGETLAILAAPDKGTALFHCAGGQDRTGIIAALLLGLAGVPATTIAEDYTLTAEYIVDRYHGADAPPGVDPADYTVEAYRQRNCMPEVMLLTLEHLDRQYGGVEGYVRSARLSDRQIGDLRGSFVE
jgi:protein-tyrosine phosphatase